MKIIATSEELKDLRNLFIQGFTSLDDKDRNELETRIKDLESDPRLSTGFDDFIEGFKEDVQCDLKKEVKRLNHIVSNKDKAIKELQQANNDLIYKLNQNRAIVTRLEKSNNNYKTEYMSLAIDVQNLKAENTELKKNVDYWKSEHGDKVLEIEKLDSKISDLIDYKYELEKKIKELEKALTYWYSQSKELALAKNPNEDLINSNQILKKAVDNLMEVIDLREKDNKALSKNLDKIVQKMAIIEKENQELKTKLEQAEKSSCIQCTTENKLRYYQTKVDSLVSKLTPPEADNNTWITINYETIKEFISSLDNAINSVIFETKFTSLDNLHESIISIIKFIESRIVTLEAANNRLKETNENLNSELNDIKQVLKQSNVELKDELNLKNEVLELQKHNIQYFNKQKELTENLVEARNLTESYRNDYVLLLPELEELKEKIETLQETNNKLNQDNQRLYNQNCDLSLNLNKIKSENDNLRTQNYELENLDNEEINKLSKEIENLNLENSKVYHRNKELEEASKKFIDLNTELESEVLELKNRLKKYLDQIKVNKFA